MLLTRVPNGSFWHKAAVVYQSRMGLPTGAWPTSAEMSVSLVVCLCETARLKMRLCETPTRL